MDQALAHYGYLVLFAGAAFEGDAFLLAATFLAHRGYLDLHTTIVVAALGTSAANHAYYWIARRHGRQALASLAASKRLSRITAAVTRHAPWLLFVSRFLYGLRIAIPAACGATGMRAGLFSAVDLAGSAVWAVTIGLAGVAIGRGLELIVEDLHRHEGLVALVILLVVVVGLAVRGRDWKGGALVEHLVGRPDPPAADPREPPA
ncbi:MAG: DedA family protein [Vicinamibacterales bacterium]